MADDKLTKQEVRLKQEELREKQKKLDALKQELKENQVARRKKRKLQEATFEQKKKHAELLKQQYVIEKQLKKTENKIDVERERVKSKALKDIKKERKEREKLIKTQQFEQIERVKLTKAQKKFYDDLVKGEEKRKKTEKEQKRLEEEKILKRGTPSTMGILGGMVTGKVKEFVSDLPIIGGLLNLRKSIREQKRAFQSQQAEIAERRLGEEGIEEGGLPIPQPVPTTTGGGEGIAVEGNFSSLLEVNRQGFKSIVDTLLKIDRGEDVEEEQERRDRERRKKEVTGEGEQEIIENAKEEGGFGGILGKLAVGGVGMIGATIGGLVKKAFTEREQDRRQRVREEAEMMGEEAGGGVKGFFVKHLHLTKGAMQDIADSATFGLLNMKKMGQMTDEQYKAWKEEQKIKKKQFDKVNENLKKQGIDITKKVSGEGRTISATDVEKNRQALLREMERQQPGKKIPPELLDPMGGMGLSFDKGGYVGYQKGGEVKATLHEGEFVLDNEASKDFLEASKRMQKFKELEKLQAKFKEAPTEEIYQQIQEVRKQIALLTTGEEKGMGLASSIARRKAILERKMAGTEDKEMKEMFKQLIAQLNMLNKSMNDNVVASNEIAKKTLGNQFVIVDTGARNGNGNDLITKMVYENANMTEQ